MIGRYGKKIGKSGKKKNPRWIRKQDYDLCGEMGPQKRLPGKQFGSCSNANSKGKRRLCVEAEEE